MCVYEVFVNSPSVIKNDLSLCVLVKLVFMSVSSPAANVTHSVNFEIFYFSRI